MKNISLLKPQDIPIILKVLIKRNNDWRQVDISSELEISQGEVAKSLSRLKKSGFILDKRVNKSAVTEFLIHGLKYTFPADIGSLTVGVPTAVSAPVFKNKILQDEDDIYVWPSSKGTVRGQALTPFYSQLAEAALKDEKFYELVSIVEALRMGRARERKIAESELREKFKKL